MPCNQCNYECIKIETICPHKEDHKSVMDSIMNSDLVYFIVPNYCGFPCANYFAYNERTVGYFSMDRALMKKYMDIPKKFILGVILKVVFLQAMRQQLDEPQMLYHKTREFGKKASMVICLTQKWLKNVLLQFLNTYIILLKYSIP